MYIINIRNIGHVGHNKVSVSLQVRHLQEDPKGPDTAHNYRGMYLSVQYSVYMLPVCLRTHWIPHT